MAFLNKENISNKYVDTNSWVLNWVSILNSFGVQDAHILCFLSLAPCQSLLQAFVGLLVLGPWVTHGPMDEPCVGWSVGGSTDKPHFCLPGRCAWLVAEGLRAEEHRGEQRVIVM